MKNIFKSILACVLTALLIASVSWAATLLPLSQGGTGASTAADARTNLGLGSIATQNVGTLTNTKYCTYATGTGFVCNSDGVGSMTYPDAGIALSTGSAWDTSITNNSANWNTAYGWGNHASAGYLTSLSGAVLTDQSTPQTIGLTGTRLAKLWATDIEVTNAIAGSVTGNAATATALAADPADCAAGTVATAINASGTLTCGITPLVSGGTLTSGYHCRYDGTGLDCDRVEDASGTCAANAVCMGGHTHPTTELSGVNAGTDLTADLEEETHASEHAVSAADTIFPADPGADRYLMWDDDPGVLVWATGTGGLASTDIDTSAELLAILTDETGTGALTFATAPTFTTSITTPSILTGNVALNIGDATTDSITFQTDSTGNAEFTLPADSIGDADIDWGTGAGQIDLADIPGGTAGASAFDLGGATSVEIPNGASPTVDAAGEIAVDTTSDQLIYYGAAKRVLVPQEPECHTINNPTDADADIMFMTPFRAITVTDVYCKVQGGTSVSMTLGDGTNNLEAITCDTDGQEDDGSIANGTFNALETMQFDLASSSGTNTWLQICVNYVFTAD